MFNCVESESTERSVSWILIGTTEAICILRASFCMKGIMSAVNYKGQLHLSVSSVSTKCTFSGSVVRLVRIGSECVCALDLHLTCSQ
jgi:hypothetical protein